MNLVSDCRGQMVVELVVVLPVVLMVLLVSVDLLFFMQQCARFDELAAQQVLARAVSPGGDASYEDDARCAAVQEALTRSISSGNIQIAVEAKRGVDAALFGEVVYVCRIETTPWPLSKGGIDFFGMKIPFTLSHTRSFAVDPYEPLLF